MEGIEFGVPRNKNNCYLLKMFRHHCFIPFIFILYSVSFNFKYSNG